MNPTALAGTADFPDRLPPMLVKELRQGLRSGGFMGLFIGLHGFLVILLLTIGPSPLPATGGAIISGVIFTVVSLALLVIQPLRGTTALWREIKAGTAEFLTLTHLGARRIVVGKWLALGSQSALLVVAILPYLLFRYSLGTMDLLAEVILMGHILAASLALTALTTGTSAAASRRLRIVVPFLLILITTFAVSGMLSGQILDGLIGICSPDRANAALGSALYLGVMTQLAWSCLSVGGSLFETTLARRAPRASATLILPAAAAP